MNSSPALRWCLILLLPLTLGWKFWVGSAPIDPLEIQPAVAAFLSRQQFKVVVDYETFKGLPIITATGTAPCRLLIVETTPLGRPIDPVQHLSTNADHSFVVFQGTAYAEEPWLLTAGNYVWYTLLCRLGLASHIPRVLTVISSCGTDDLPWSELRAI